MSTAQLAAQPKNPGAAAKEHRCEPRFPSRSGARSTTRRIKYQYVEVHA
jgi:hypothetical protein